MIVHAQAGRMVVIPPNSDKCVLFVYVESTSSIYWVKLSFINNCKKP